MAVASRTTEIGSPPFRAHPGKRDRSYVPSYDWGASSLGPRHDRIAHGMWNVPGWLAPEDALKLYELAYYADGPILEIGTYCGRSAVTMAIALEDAGRPHRILSIDVDPAAATLAHRHARAHAVEDRIVLVTSTAERFLAGLPVLAPALIFVDGDHRAAGVREDLDAIAPHVRPGTLLLFHDYLPGEIPDTEGFAVAPNPIEVAEAVESSWVPGHADFAGTFGWSGLYRVTSPPG